MQKQESLRWEVHERNFLPGNLISQVLHFGELLSDFYV